MYSNGLLCTDRLISSEYFSIFLSIMTHIQMLREEEHYIWSEVGNRDFFKES